MVGTAFMTMRILIDSTSNYILQWGKIHTARGQTDGGVVAGESCGEIRWALFVERPQISPLLQDRDIAAVGLATSCGRKYGTVWFPHTVPRHPELFDYCEETAIESKIKLLLDEFSFDLGFQ
jgi:hypothetical protein